MYYGLSIFSACYVDLSSTSSEIPRHTADRWIPSLLFPAELSFRASPANRICAAAAASAVPPGAHCPRAAPSVCVSQARLFADTDIANR